MSGSGEEGYEEVVCLYCSASCALDPFLYAEGKLLVIMLLFYYHLSSCPIKITLARWFLEPTEA
jgi:hypothetical protein